MYIPLRLHTFGRVTLSGWSVARKHAQTRAGGRKKKEKWSSRGGRGSLIRVATWCAMMWDGVESACYHRARGGLVRVCVCVWEWLGEQGVGKTKWKRAFVFGIPAQRGKERERERWRGRMSRGMQLQFVPLTVRGKNRYCLAGEKRIELLWSPACEWESIFLISVEAKHLPRLVAPFSLPTCSPSSIRRRLSRPFVHTREFKYLRRSSRLVHLTFSIDTR